MYMYSFLTIDTQAFFSLCFDCALRSVSSNGRDNALMLSVKPHYCIIDHSTIDYY